MEGWKEGCDSIANIIFKANFFMDFFVIIYNYPEKSSSPNQPAGPRIVPTKKYPKEFSSVRDCFTVKKKQTPSWLV